MMKGQAFDTFKLMIAAVVAVAILGILLTILGQINIAGQNFEDATRSLLRDASANPGGIRTSSGTVNFKGGNTYPADMFYGSSSGMSVVFQCAETYTAGDTPVVSVCDDTGVEVERDFKADLKLECKSETGINCCAVLVGPKMDFADIDWESCTGPSY